MVLFEKLLDLCLVYSKENRYEKINNTIYCYLKLCDYYLTDSL